MLYKKNAIVVVKYEHDFLSCMVAKALSISRQSFFRTFQIFGELPRCFQMELYSHLKRDTQSFSASIEIAKNFGVNFTALHLHKTKLIVKIYFYCLAILSCYYCWGVYCERTRRKYFWGSEELRKMRFRYRILFYFYMLDCTSSCEPIYGCNSQHQKGFFIIIPLAILLRHVLLIVMRKCVPKIPYIYSYQEQANLR